MRRRYRWSFPLVAVAMAIPLAAPPPVRDAPPPAVVYVPGEPHYIAGPGVRRAEWSPDGRYALVVLPSHRPQGPDFRLVLWSRRTGRTALDWTPPWPDAHLAQTTWFAAGHTAIAVILAVEPGGPPEGGGRIQRLHLLQLDAGKHAAVDRTPRGMGPIATVNPSPTQPLMLLQDTLDSGTRIRFLTPESVSDPVALPDGLDGAVWSPDGTTPLFLGFPAGGPTAFTRFEPAGGQWTRLPERPALYRRPNPPFQVTRQPTPIRHGGGSALIHPLWIVSGAGSDAVSELLCADGDEPKVTASGDAVLYQTDGIALFREVSAERGAEYLARRKAAAVQRAESNSKQIALALIQYAQDDGNTFPPADGMHDAVDALIRSGDVWYGANGDEGFAYTLGGGALPGDAPATTRLGYHPAPGGRWDVFADGHVEWLPNP